MAWDLIGDMNRINYKAEKVFNTAFAFVAGGPTVGSATASYYSGEANRNAAKKERENHFVNLRNSATRAGYNPLTALYATGGGGYGQYVPLISRNPLGDALVAGANAYTAGAARREQMAHDKSMETMRQQHDMKITRLTNDALMGRAKFQANENRVLQDLRFGEQEYLQERSYELEAGNDPLKDYRSAGKVPVKLADGGIRYLPIDVADRMRLTPMATLTGGEVEELAGELIGGWYNLTTPVGRHATGRGMFLGLRTDEVPAMQWPENWSRN